MVCRPIGSGAQDQIACHTANFPSRSLELALELAYQYVIAGVALWRRAYTPSANQLQCPCRVDLRLVIWCRLPLRLDTFQLRGCA